MGWELVDVDINPVIIALYTIYNNFCFKINQNIFPALKVDVHSIRFCPYFIRFCTFFALQHLGMEIFFRLDIHMMLYSIPCCVNYRFCQQTSFCTFLFAKTNRPLLHTLPTTSDI